ncbi:fructosamine kinase family protein [Pseudooceanicola sp. LIPI14-2-Ac024]|uniref:fructosamine kinase family protein n=1 Tax=Pseudooceanicola sp. LIPI14-2-Ac024 TaxID=3344875 RepID=UPI0035CEBB6B
MTLNARIATALGADVTDLSPLQGGDLSRVEVATLSDGRRVVAKSGPRVEAEARMLKALALAGAAVPEVLHAEPGLMLLTHLPETRPEGAAWTTAGHMLRQLHDHTAATPGWPEDYAFGAMPIPNAPADDWPTFWSDRRLLAAPEAQPPDLARRIEALCTRLPDMLPAVPALSLLHGDLWSGNLLFGPGSTVHLIDPACYHGHAEVDLAMLHLFGRPGAGFAEAYGPLDPGWESRRAVYTLWPALVHLHNFGATYRPMVEQLLRDLGF